MTQQEELRQSAEWLRWLTNADVGVRGMAAARRLADYLDAQAAAMEAAAAPAQPAAVEPRCDRCRWWVLLGVDGVNGSFGRCCRYPPLEHDRKDGELYGVFPKTTGIQRCGEFAPREVAP